MATIARDAAPSASAPFEQGRFEELPERPRVPHRYYAAAAAADVVVASQPFGRIRTRVVSD